MPHHVVEKIADALNSQSKAVRGSKILILGIAYKRDIDDIRESPALDVMAVLKQRGGLLNYHDPYAPHLAAREWPGGVDMASVPLTTQTLADADCVVIITDHKTFNHQEIVTHAPLIVDTRNALKGSWPHVFKLGAP